MPDAPAKTKWIVIAVVVVAIAGALALLLTERDYAAPEKRALPEARSVPERLQKKPEPKPPIVPPVKPLPPEEQTITIRKEGVGAVGDVQSADTFIQFDADRDGVVDRHEARYSDFLSANFDAIDSSRDGKISMDEMRTFDSKRAR